MLRELDEMEKRLNQEFRVKNSIAREEKSQKESGKSWEEVKAEKERAEVDRLNQIMEERRVEAERRMEQTWKTLKIYEKATEYPRRFLKEAFPPGGPEVEAIVLKSLCGYSRKQLKSEAKGLGLHTGTVGVPNIFEGDGGSSHKSSESSDDDSELSDNDSEKWIVIGKEEVHVTAKIQRIKRGLSVAKQKLHAAQEEDLRRGKGWDVTGSWRIKCPKLEKEYRVGNLTMDIYRDKSTGNLQMYARFDFGIVEGILRFEKPGAKEPVFDRLKPRTERGWGEYMSQEEEVDDDDENFQLGPNDNPSPQNSSWNFRWHGKETGESEIQLYSEEKLCKITFSGPGGCKVTGTFPNEYVGDCVFSGVKVAAEPRGARFDIRGVWRDHNEEAYESARVGRWH